VTHQGIIIDNLLKIQFGKRGRTCEILFSSISEARHEGDDTPCGGDGGGGRPSCRIALTKPFLSLSLSLSLSLFLSSRGHVEKRKG
jgi:hypothetical protein